MHGDALYVLLVWVGTQFTDKFIIKCDASGGQFGRLILVKCIAVQLASHVECLSEARLKQMAVCGSPK